MGLTGEQFRLLKAALVKAYPTVEALDEMVTVSLNENRAVIAGGSNLGSMVFALIQWADARGPSTVAKVVAPLRRDHSELEEVKAALNALGSTYAPLGPTTLGPSPVVTPAPHEHLSQQRLLELASALTAAGVCTADALDTMAASLDPRVVASLPTSGVPQARLLQTLQHLNRLPRLSNGTLPLVDWLGTAEFLVATRPEVNVVRAARSEVTGAAAGSRGPTVAETKAATRREDGGQERIVHDDDMLPYGFLEAGVEVGRSVARLVVPRIEDGQATSDLYGKPSFGYGSGWLLTGDLLITNHHVVDNREAHEPEASLADLGLQAKGTIVQFDYDGPASTPKEYKVRELVAWSSRTGPYDYAVLRLESAVPRAPLRVLRAPVKVTTGDPKRQALNIIQHPGRGQGAAMTMYKMIACRNNIALRTKGPDLWYFTDTERGSSGSPVCNDAWQVVALHKAWRFVDDVSFQGKTTAWANVGTLMVDVLADLAAAANTDPKKKAAYEEIDAAQPGK